MANPVFHPNNSHDCKIIATRIVPQYSAFKLYWFCCCCIAISILVLPFALTTQFLAVHTVVTQLRFLPLFARLHQLAKGIIYTTVELLKRIPLALIGLVCLQNSAVRRFLFLYFYFYIGCKLNLHKFQHTFRDTLDQMCPSNDGIEDTEHFLLLCPSFDLQQRDRLAGVLAILRPFGHNNLSNKVLTQYLLYSSKDLSIDLNRKILELTSAFIHNTGRFY